MRIAVPAEDASGFDALRSSRFSAAPYFAVVELEPFGVKFVEALENPGDADDEARAALLAEAGVKAVVAMGVEPELAVAFAQADISVYREGDSKTVRQVAVVFGKAAPGGVPLDL